MSKVVFITPNMLGSFGDDVHGTMLLATILDQAGIDCEILPFFCIGEMTSLDGFLDSAITAIGQRQPKIVSFYTRCDTYHIMLKMAQRIKAQWPEMYVVLGGPQSDITAQDVVKLPYVDYVCCGEGETTIVPFFTSLLGGKPDTGIDGLVYLENGVVQKNPRPQLLKDLDALPMIDYSFFHFDENSVKTAFPIDVGRGCPFGCTYCSTKAFWGRKFRLKSPERIVEEVKRLHELFGATSFAFSHDMFTLNRASVIKTCELLRQLDFPVRWRCSARLDCIDRELIDIMTDSGLVSLYMGIETGSPRMQKLVNKNLDLSNALPILSYLKEKKCKTTASFIFGFPEETEEDLSQTMSLIADLLNLRNVAVQTHLCTFLAGTELSARHMSEMTKAEQYSDITGNYFLEDCSDLIEAHPELFSHLLEYKTPMRTRLRYFPIFFQLWKYMLPVYQYLSEKYPRQRLIDMYYDFAEANKDILDDILALPGQQQLRQLAAQDQFPAKFRDDPHYAVIKDLYRYKIAEMDAISGDGAETCETYCFNPSDIKTKSSLAEYRRCIAIVRRKKDVASVQICPV